jgi:predicted HTH transcriptional regulator
MVEFKSTLRWNVNKGGVDKKMENIIIKSIAALSNRYGGALFIGVREVGAKAEVIGLDLDYQTLHEPNKDQFEVHLRNLINSAYGINFATSNIDIKFPTINDNEFCLIDVKRGSEPLYTDTQSPHPNVPSTELFYVRSGNTSQQLPIEEAAIYIANRFSLNS